MLLIWQPKSTAQVVVPPPVPPPPPPPDIGSGGALGRSTWSGLDKKRRQRRQEDAALMQLGQRIAERLAADYLARIKKR